MTARRALRWFEVAAVAALFAVPVATAAATAAADDEPERRAPIDAVSEGGPSPVDLEPTFATTPAADDDTLASALAAGAVVLGAVGVYVVRRRHEPA